MFQDTVVEIDRPLQKKAFLGGFRNRLTGVEYHHAAVQTLPKKRPDRGVVVFSRDTQVNGSAPTLDQDATTWFVEGIKRKKRFKKFSLTLEATQCVCALRLKVHFTAESWSRSDRRQNTTS